MSNIVVLVGSVRKNGNTQLLAEAFARGAALHNQVELVSVADYTIHPCIGCNSCFQREGNTCFMQDDMTAIYEKLLAADTLVIASPIYFYNISAQLKALIDRLHAPIRNRFGIRRMGLILDGEGKDPSVFRSTQIMYQEVVDWFKLETIGQVLVNGVRNPGDVNNQPDKLEEAFRMGEALR